jgi:hypothetical protein
MVASRAVDRPAANWRAPARPLRKDRRRRLWRLLRHFVRRHDIDRDGVRRNRRERMDFGKENQQQQERQMYNRRRRDA